MIDDLELMNEESVNGKRQSAARLTADAVCRLSITDSSFINCRSSIIDVRLSSVR